MAIYTNPKVQLVRGGERWKLLPLRTGGAIEARLSHHAIITGSWRGHKLPGEEEVRSNLFGEESTQPTQQQR